MTLEPRPPALKPPVWALGEAPLFKPGDRVRIGTRRPVGHYRVPTYVRGRRAVVEAVVEPTAVDNEEEGFGRNAGSRRHYYRVGIPLADLWPDYGGPAADGLRIEVFETWLTPADARPDHHSGGDR